MRSASLPFAQTASVFFFCSLRLCFAQIVGCDGAGITCPTKDARPRGGVCSYSERGIGIATFDSNITEDVPLTWTITGEDDTRAFYLGTPPSLDLAKITDYGACALIVSNASSVL